MRRVRFEAGEIIAAAAAGLVAAAVLFFALSGLSRPHAFKTRANAVEKRIAQAEQSADAGGDARAFAPGAVCGDASKGADVLKHRIETAAAQASVALTSLAVSPPPPGQIAGRMAPVTLQFEANGKYEAVVKLLDAVGQPAPEVFVDSVDLKPASGGGASIKLSGEAWCWTGRA